MNDIFSYVMCLVLGIVVFMFIIDRTAGDRMESRILDMQQQAIERGYALYCPRSGEFAWAGECEEE